MCTCDYITSLKERYEKLLSLRTFILVLLHVHVYLRVCTACSGHQHLLHGEIMYIIEVTICFQALDTYGATLP